MAQLVGQPCVICNAVIRSRLDGAFCPECQRASHDWCRAKDDLEASEMHCPECGYNLPAPPSPTEDVQTPYYSKLFGNLLIILSGVIISLWLILRMTTHYADFDQPIGWIVFATMLVAASKFYWTGKKLSSVHFRNLIAHDKRPPILLLRSFRDDEAWTVLSRPWLKWVFGFFLGPLGDVFANLFRMESFEEALCESLSRFGPVVAIGRPGERFATLGAAREYLNDHEWQKYVLNLIPTCNSIILMIGTTGGLAWEMDQLVRLKMLSKVILLLPPVNRPEMHSRWQAFQQSIASLDDLHLPSTVSDDATLGVFDWQLNFYCVKHREMDRSIKSFEPKVKPYIESLVKQLKRRGSAEVANSRDGAQPDSA